MAAASALGPTESNAAAIILGSAALAAIDMASKAKEAALAAAIASASPPAIAAVT